MSALNRFELAIQVQASDIDPQGHVNNVVFLRFVQDLAVAHWRAVAPAELQCAVGWVVRRHEIDYLRPGMLGDQLLGRTWLGEPSGATWERLTEISRPADGQVLVKARTVWVLLDAGSGRPRRVDRRLTGFFEEVRPDQPGADAT